jgi:predicted DNA-binding transcriptional regulator YafY
MFFNVIHNDKNRLICTERLSGIQILTEKFIEPYGKDTVIFVLKGDLADRYILKENEKIVGFAESDGLAISTIGESKEALLSRLLRYDDRCEIKKPHSYREEMKKILDDTLKNYGVA